MKKFWSVDERAPDQVPPGLRRSTVLAAGSVGASVFVTISALLATAFILRLLSPDEAGRFAVLVELLYALGVLGALGQANLHARIYQQMPAVHFDWWADLRCAFWLTFPVLLLGALALRVPYELNIFEVVFLCLGGELFVLVSCFSAILGQQQHYAWSSALLRMANGLLILPVGLMLIGSSWRSLNFVLLSLLVFLALTTLVGGWLLSQRLRRGEARILFKERLAGLALLAMLLAIIATQRGLIVVSGAILTEESVASLAAVVVLLRVFDLIGEPAGRVFSTEMARHPRAISRGLLVAPWLLAGVLSFVLLFGLPPLIHWFYTERYDAALPLLPCLVVAGALRFVEIVPRGFLAYLAPSGLLNRFAIVQCVAAVIGLALMAKWTMDYGLRGTVWAGAIIAAARVALSYLFYANVRRNARLTSASATTGERLAVEPLETRGEQPPV